MQGHSNITPPLWPQILWFVIPLIWASGMLVAQYHGEDEALTMLRVQEIVQGLKSADFFYIAKAIGGDWHPPGRNLLPVPFILLFGDALWVLRLPNLFIWGGCVLIAAQMAQRMAGIGAAWTTALLLGLSGLFQIEAMGFGHGLGAFWGLALCRHLLWNPPRSLSEPGAKRDFAVGGILAAAGFLWFTTMAMLGGIYHLYYFWLAWRDRANRKIALRQTIVSSIPFGLFYVGYYAIFLGIPYYLLATGAVNFPIGQLHQYLARTGGFGLNVDGLVENFSVANWYLFPFITIGIVGAGLIALWRNHRVIFMVLMPYLLIVNIVMGGNTGQHFLSWIVWCMPFAVAFAYREPVSGAMRLLSVTVVGATAVWSAVIHVPIYNEMNYPFALMEPAFGQAKWLNNVHRPVGDIALALKDASQRHLKMTSLDDASFQLQVFPSANWARIPDRIKAGDCIASIVDKADGRPIQVVLYDRTKLRPCHDRIASVTTFPNSNLEIGYLRH